MRIDLIHHRIRLVMTILALTLSSLFISMSVYADQTYNVDSMSGIYSGTWIHTAYGFTYYEPVSGFADMRGSQDAIRSDAVYYRYNKALDLFILIYRGFQDYEPTLGGIRNYVADLGCTDIMDVNCNGMGAIQFQNHTNHSTELSIAFPDPEGAIMQVTVQCPDDGIRYMYAGDVFRSIMPDTTSDTYLDSIGEESYGHVYHLADFSSVYSGSWITLLDYFKFCAPENGGWKDLTGTEDALSCEAIAMFQNDSLGIVIIIYYGYQPYNTTEGIYQALIGNSYYHNIRYVRCNGLKSVEFDNGKNDRMIAFADQTGGIVQVTVQCPDAVTRQTYAEQLFSSVMPLDVVLSDEDTSIPQEYKSFLSNYTVDAGGETLSLENSQFGVHDVNQDGTQELLIRPYSADSAGGLGSIYIFVLIDGRVQYAGTLRMGGTAECAGYTVNGYFYEGGRSHMGDMMYYNVYRLDGASLIFENKLEVYLDSGQPIASIDDQPVSFEALNEKMKQYFGLIIIIDSGTLNCQGLIYPEITENIYFGQEIAQTAVQEEGSKPDYEVSDLIGQDIATVATQYGCTQSHDSDGFTYYSDEDGYLNFGDPGTGIVTEIGIFQSPFDEEVPYTLYGAGSSLDCDEFEAIAEENGFWQTKNPTVYTDGNGLYLTWICNEIKLNKYNLPDPAGRIEVSEYMGASLEEVWDYIPNHVYAGEPDYSCLYDADGGVYFEANSTVGVPMDEQIVKYIEVSSDKYCLYGSSGEVDFSKAGFHVREPGVYVDPLGSTLVCSSGSLYLENETAYFWSEEE